jgi:hypothetical protein
VAEAWLGSYPWQLDYSQGGPSQIPYFESAFGPNNTGFVGGNEHNPQGFVLLCPNVVFGLQPDFRLPEAGNFVLPTGSYPMSFNKIRVSAGWTSSTAPDPGLNLVLDMWNNSFDYNGKDLALFPPTHTASIPLTVLPALDAADDNTCRYPVLPAFSEATISPTLTITNRQSVLTVAHLNNSYAPTVGFSWGTIDFGLFCFTSNTLSFVTYPNLPVHEWDDHPTQGDPTCLPFTTGNPVLKALVIEFSYDLSVSNQGGVGIASYQKVVQTHTRGFARVIA